MTTLFADAILPPPPPPPGAPIEWLVAGIIAATALGWLGLWLARRRRVAAA